MTPRVGPLAVLVLALACLPSCGAVSGVFGLKDYDVTVRAGDLKEIGSMYAIVGPDQELAAEKPEDVSGLVHPDKQRKYAVFAQFKPRADGQPGWERGANLRGDFDLVELEASTDGTASIIEAKLDQDFIEMHPGVAMAVVVHYANREWAWEKIPNASLVSGGSSVFEIGPTGLVRKAK